MENTKLNSGKLKKGADRESCGHEINVCVDSNIQAEHYQGWSEI